MLSLHTRIAILTILPLVVWGAYVLGAREQGTTLPRPTDIGVEHTGAAAFTFTHTVNDPPLLIDVKNEGKETAYVSLPAIWERKEVRGAKLSQIEADEPAFDYRRWHIPAGATLSFRSKETWNGILVHNASEGPLQLSVVAVDLLHNTSAREAYLLSDVPMFIP